MLIQVILREGTGDEGPGTGDEVVVHYVGTLANGEKFDSSRDRDDKFKFKLGQGACLDVFCLLLIIFLSSILCGF